MSTPTPRPYAGQSLAERRRVRSEQLLTSGLDRLHADGLSGISVRTICADARLTPRYFYEHFTNLDDLLVALVDLVGDEVAAVSVTNLVDDSGEFRDRVRRCLLGVFGVVWDDPRKASVLLAAAAHPAMQRRQQERFLEFARLGVQFLGGDDIDPQRLQPVALFLVGGGVELISAKLSGLIELTDDDLVDRCVDIFVAAWTTVGVPLPGA